MPYSREHDCLFVHIPKTGGTSIESMLDMHGSIRTVGIEPYLNQQPDMSKVFGRELTHLTLRELAKLLGESVVASSFTCSIVRHPLDRLVSQGGWIDGKWARGEELKPSWFQQYLRSADWQHRHFLPQHEFLALNQREIAVDYLGRFEELSSAWVEIERHLALEHRVLEHRMRSTRGDYMTYFDDETLELACRHYARDFELLGYKLP